MQYKFKQPRKTMAKIVPMAGFDNPTAYSELEKMCNDLGVRMADACHAARVERSLMDRWKVREPKTYQIMRRMKAGIMACHEEQKERQETTQESLKIGTLLIDVLDTQPEYVDVTISRYTKQEMLSIANFEHPGHVGLTVKPAEILDDLPFEEL